MPRRSLAARRIAAAAIVLLCSLTAAGCGRTPGAGPADSVEPVAVPVDTLTMDEIRSLSMPTAEKQQALPPELPVQVPVIRGEIAEASAAGGVVFYRLQVAASPERTEEWYRRMYVIANWTLVSQRGFEDPGGPIRLLQFEKGDAKSSVSISENGETSAVRGTVTVGAVSSEV